MTSGSVVFSKCAKALSGTALLMAELVVDSAVEVIAESALAGGIRVFAVGVYSAEVVNAFEPAEDDPEDAKEEAAAVPVVPEDALA